MVSSLLQLPTPDSSTTRHRQRRLATATRSTEQFAISWTYTRWYHFARQSGTKVRGLTSYINCSLQPLLTAIAAYHLWIVYKILPFTAYTRPLGWHVETKLNFLSIFTHSYPGPRRVHGRPQPGFRQWRASMLRGQRHTDGMLPTVAASPQKPLSRGLYMLNNSMLNVTAWSESQSTCCM